MSDRIDIIGPNGKRIGYYTLPSDYDNDYFYKETPYAFQNLKNGLVNNNEVTINNELSKAIKGVDSEDDSNNPFQYLKIINTEIEDNNLQDVIYERDYANKFGEWINTNFKFSKRELLDDIFEPKFSIFWNDYYNTYYGIWYITKTIDGTTLTEQSAKDIISNLHNSPSYILDDTNQIVLRTTKELGFSLFDIENARINNFSPRVLEKLADLVHWGEILTKVQIYYYLLLNKSVNNELLKHYLFVDEDNVYFSNIYRTFFSFELSPKDYYGDLNNAINYDQLNYWNSSKDYAAGDLVLGTNLNDSTNYNYLYRCVNTHKANGKFERTVIVNKNISGGKTYKSYQQQWEYLTDDYALEMEALNKACSVKGKTFNRSNWKRFVLNPIEGNNEIEYFTNGEIKPSSHSGTLTWNASGISLRQVIHVGLNKKSFKKIDEILEAEAEEKGTKPETVEGAITEYKILLRKDELTPEEETKKERDKEIINMVPRIRYYDFINIENYPWLKNGEPDYTREDVYPWDDIEPEDRYLVKNAEWSEQLTDRHSSPCDALVTNVNTGGKIIRYFEIGKIPTTVTATLEGKLKSIRENAFLNRKELKKVVLRSGVTSIGKKAFSGCTNLRHALLPKNLKILGTGAFAGCQSLGYVTIPKNVTMISGVYAGCTNLKSVVLSPKCTYLGDSTFMNCTNLKRIYNIDKINYIGTDVFNGCESLEYFNINKNIKKIPTRAFKNCKKCNFDISNEVAITLLGEGSFEGCEKLTTVVDLANVDKLYPNTFKNCKSLTSISIPLKSIPSSERVKENGVTLNTYIIPSHFCYGCTNLKTVIFDNKTEQLDDSCFENCASLTAITIPSNVNTIGKRIFYDDFQLGRLNIPSRYVPMEGQSIAQSSKWIEVVLTTENRNNWVDRLFTQVYENGRRVYW